MEETKISESLKAIEIIQFQAEEINRLSVTLSEYEQEIQRKDKAIERFIKNREHLEASVEEWKGWYGDVHKLLFKEDEEEKRCLNLN